MKLNIVLLEPEIPQNTGNIGRTCVATDTMLHIIKPCGFFLDDKYVKKAGMDYWKDLKLNIYDSFEHFCVVNDNPRIFMATTKARKLYTEVKYQNNDFIMLGKESKGIPEELLMEYGETSIRIPMANGCRSLNLANSAAIVLYEALRQNNFENFVLEGQLHDNAW